MMDSNPNPDPVPETDLHAQHQAHERKEMLAASMLALPNLFLHPSARWRCCTASSAWC